MSQTHTQNIAKLFLPDTSAADTPVSFIEEVGTLIFQSALMKQMVTLPDADADTFNSFIETHVEHESFVEELCQEYPAFEKILENELRAFQSEIISH